MALRPPLDEPLTGLDAAIARQVKDLLAARVRAGATIILTTHILEVAERLADRIGIVFEGRLVAEGTVPELKRAVVSLSSDQAPLTPRKARTHTFRIECMGIQPEWRVC